MYKTFNITFKMQNGKEIEAQLEAVAEGHVVEKIEQAGRFFYVKEKGNQKLHAVNMDLVEEFFVYDEIKAPAEDQMLMQQPRLIGFNIN